LEAVNIRCNVSAALVRLVGKDDDFGDEGRWLAASLGVLLEWIHFSPSPVGELGVDFLETERTRCFEGLTGAGAASTGVAFQGRFWRIIPNDLEGAGP
jgi:hypothetical protein